MENNKRKKLKMKVFTSCLALGLVIVTMLTPVTALAFDSSTQLDGTLSTIYQGSVGDCGAISAIQAFDNSVYGKNLLKKMITVNSNGSYTLNFATKKQTVTQQNVSNAYVEGDLDARVIEAGLQKAMNIYNGCFSCDVFTTITGFKQKTYYNNNTTKTNIMNTMASKFASGQGVIGACDFTIADDSLGIIGDGGHSYSICWVDANEVAVINPWNTSTAIYMSRSQFENSIRYMTYVDESAKKVVVYWD